VTALHQHTKIAVALGYSYEDMRIGCGEKGIIATMRVWKTPEGDGMGKKWPPNYPHDLNAMHEAKQALWKKDWGYRYIFNDHLANIIKGRIVNRNEWDAETLLDATAEQQAEAFLKTLNLWEES
jgi:hypothetical protein